MRAILCAVGRIIFIGWFVEYHVFQEGFCGALDVQQFGCVWLFLLC